MKKCKISFECDADSAKVIVGLIVDNVTNLSMFEVLDGPASKSRAVSDGNSSKERSTDWVKKYATPVVDFFKKRGGEISHKDHDLLATIERAGLKASSISPLLSDMVKHNKLERVRRGTYRLKV
jgi:hypothetical protein